LDIAGKNGRLSSALQRSKIGWLSKLNCAGDKDALLVAGTVEGDGDNVLTNALGLVAGADCKTSFERKLREKDDDEAL
jgi:hypothetical protein